MKVIKELLKKIPFLKSIVNFLRSVVHYIKKRIEIKTWYKMGKPIPPPHIIKELTIKYYARKFFCPVLVETGTYLGDMIEATKRTFERIYSIEIAPFLYEQAKKRFNKYKHINIFIGDSGKVMPTLLKKISKPVIFWLDGHYSGDITGRGELETPIIEELKCILSHPNRKVILIDDARCFNGENDYPTLKNLENFVLGIDASLSLKVIDDIIRT